MAQLVMRTAKVEWEYIQFLNLVLISMTGSVFGVREPNQNHTSYLSSFKRAKFLENKIYTQKTRKLQQNTQ